MPTELDFNAATLRLTAILDWFAIPSQFTQAFAEQVYQRAIESEPWSMASLLTLQKDRSRPLSISGSSLPTVKFYSPIKAAECATETALAVLHIDRPPLAVLSALAAYFALREIVTPVAAAETLLFLVVYESPSHVISLDAARSRFNTDAKLHQGISEDDFRMALTSLQHLGCVWHDGETIKIANRVLLR